MLDNFLTTVGGVVVSSDSGLYSIFPSKISEIIEEQREHTLKPGTIEMSKLNKSCALLFVIITFPKN